MASGRRPRRGDGEGNWVEWRSRREVLRAARDQSRVLITHDADFGGLAILEAEPVLCVLYLCPGHIDAAKTIEILKGVLRSGVVFAESTLVVAQRAGKKLKIRTRRV